MTRTIALLGMAYLALIVGRTDAASVFLEVSPENLDVGGFEFAIDSKTKPDGRVAFRVKIMASGRKSFSRNPDLSLGRVEITESKRAIKTIRALKMNRRGKAISAEFSVDRSLVEDPHVCMIFTNYVEVMIDGKLTPMPSADFFLVRLENFSAE